MLVNRDEGQGVGFWGAVPAGTTLSFTEEGRVLLDATDVTSIAYAWKGACFAEEAALRPARFRLRWSGRESGTSRALCGIRRRPMRSAPPSSFPHAGDSLPMPTISVGETRFALLRSGSALLTSRPRSSGAGRPRRAASGGRVPRPVGLRARAVGSTSDCRGRVAGWHERSAVPRHRVDSEAIRGADARRCGRTRDAGTGRVRRQPLPAGWRADGCEVPGRAVGARPRGARLRGRRRSSARGWAPSCGACRRKRKRRDRGDRRCRSVSPRRRPSGPASR